MYMTGAVFTSQKIFSEHDADNSGTMDMFKMRRALSQQGKVSLIFAIKVIVPVLSSAAWISQKTCHAVCYAVQVSSMLQV